MIEFKTQFVYLLAFAVGFNFLFDKLKSFSCTTNHFLDENLWARHFMYFVPLFFVIVLFTSNNSNLSQLPDFQRYYKLLMVTCIMYMVFLLLVRCEVQAVLLIGALMVLLYCIYSEIAYTKLKLKSTSTECLDEEEANKIQGIVFSLEKSFMFILYLTAGVLLFGVVTYIGRQTLDHNSDWSWWRFWFGTETCGSKKYQGHEHSLLINFGYGIAKLIGVKK